MLANAYTLLREIAVLPVVNLCFHVDCEPDDVRQTYKAFTGPHPKYKLISYKSIGVALLDLEPYATPEEYIGSLREQKADTSRINAVKSARKALSRGYTVTEIDRNALIDDIHAIHTSSEFRQGRPMDVSYLEKPAQYEDRANRRSYGVFNTENRLVAYITLGFFGNFALLDRLIGYRNPDGAMYLLVVDVVSRLIVEKRCRFVMYDTFFGAQPGMRLFKSALGFRPYRAKYSIK